MCVPISLLRPKIRPKWLSVSSMADCQEAVMLPLQKIEDTLLCSSTADYKDPHIPITTRSKLHFFVRFFSSSSSFFNQSYVFFLFFLFLSFSPPSPPLSLFSLAHYGETGMSLQRHRATLKQTVDSDTVDAVNFLLVLSSGTVTCYRASLIGGVVEDAG